MKHFSLPLLVAVLLFSFVSHAGQSGWITYERLAGTYVGNRTETWPDGFRRYDEAIVIDDEGHFANFTYQDGVVVDSGGGQFQISEDGTVPIGDVGELTLSGKNGNHLEITVTGSGG